MSKIVYVVLTETGTLLSRAIKLYTHETFNHASIAFDRELREMYSFGRKRENNPFVGGFVHEDPASNLFSNSCCAIYACPVSDEQYFMLKRLVQHYKFNKHNYKYNFIGLFGFACRLKLKRNNAFFCSQFVATLLEQAGISLDGKSPYFTKPTDLIKLPNMKFCYLGKMKYYTGLDQPTTMPNITAIQHIA